MYLPGSSGAKNVTEMSAVSPGFRRGISTSEYAVGRFPEMLWSFKYNRQKYQYQNLQTTLTVHTLLEVGSPVSRFYSF